MALLAPIPGQSLTDEPNNFAWERPPEISDPDEAVVFHLDRLSEKPIVDSVLHLLQMGFPVDVLTRSILTGAVGSGMHSIDVSLLISPVIEEEIAYMGTTAGINFKDTFGNDTDDEIQEKKLKDVIMVRLEEELGKGDESFIRETTEALGSSQESALETMQDEATPEQEEQQQEIEDNNPIDRGQGLMSRGV
jgi:predicted transcriptional regulator